MGLAPLYALRGVKRTVFVERHVVSALAFWALAIPVFASCLLIVALVSLLMVFARPVHDAVPAERIGVNLVAALVIFWAAAGLLGAHQAMRGHAARIPVLSDWAGRLASAKARRGAAAAVLALYALAALTAGAAAHGSALASAEPLPAQAYMLYDDMGWVPRWVYALGFYRVTRAANARWGAGASVVAPLTEESLVAALREGCFVFIASHGDEDGFFNRERWFTPADVAAVTRGPDLSLVYITGCDTGRQARQWEEALAPAATLTFDRISATLEHAAWLWLRGPTAVRGLPEGG